MHDSPVHGIGRMFAWFTGTFALNGMGETLQAHGLTWSATASFIGALGTFFFGCVAASKELRAWLDREASKSASLATLKLPPVPSPAIAPKGDTLPGK